MQQKIKLTGRLIEDNSSVILIISSDINEIGKVANEYQETFPDIFLSAEWGYFKPQVSSAKKKALANLFSALNGPLQNIFGSL